MGDPIPDSTHAATILRNIPELWQAIAQTICMIHAGIDKVEEKLEAHEADPNVIKISDQAATAFIAWANQVANLNMRRGGAANIGGQ